MTSEIQVYMPNISTDALIDLLTLKLGDLAPWVSLQRLKRKVRFRAPELCITLNERTVQLQVAVVQSLIESAKMLGASQFTFERKGFSMRRQPTDVSPERIEQMLIAFNTFDLEQINIY